MKASFTPRWAAIPPARHHVVIGFCRAIVENIICSNVEA